MGDYEDKLNRIDSGEDRPATFEAQRKEMGSDQLARPSDALDRLKETARDMYNRVTGNSVDSNRGRRDSRR